MGESSPMLIMLLTFGGDYYAYPNSDYSAFQLSVALAYLGVA